MESKAIKKHHLLTFDTGFIPSPDRGDNSFIVEVMAS